MVDPGVGRPFLFAGGVDNGFARADLVVLDPDNFGGTSRSDPAHQLPGNRPREWARILFPQSCISKAGASFNLAASMQPVGNILEVGVIEEPGEFDSIVIHNFRPGLNYRGASLTSTFAGRHHELESTGVLHHRLDTAREESELSKIEWLTRPPESESR